jgi:SAM-dependent methyltransferase
MIRDTCRACNSIDLHTAIDFGRTPLANSFMNHPVDLNDYSLSINVCGDCYNLQLTDVVSPDEMFKDYRYVSSTATSFRKHFEDAAVDYISRFFLDEDSLVLDIGSNDGIALVPFQERGIRVVGVEPAKNICDIATGKGIPTICGYFDENILQYIDKADVVTASNVFAHIDDIESVTRNVFKILKPGGCFIIEVQYLLRTLEDETFDNIYHEHVNYWSVNSIVTFFDRLGYNVFDVEEIDTHGGSIRVFVDNGNRLRKWNVSDFRVTELNADMYSLDTYYKFYDKVMKRKTDLMDYLSNIDGTVIGYGAAAKASTLMNVFGIDNNVLAMVIDDSVLKQNKYIPGTGVPIKPASSIPDDTTHIVILAWNFADYIIKNNEDLLDRGITFIVPGKELRFVRK